MMILFLLGLVALYGITLTLWRISPSTPKLKTAGDLKPGDIVYFLGTNSKVTKKIIVRVGTKGCELELEFSDTTKTIIPSLSCTASSDNDYDLYFNSSQVKTVLEERIIELIDMIDKI